ncbi:MAG: TIGR01459 family HAD-type hydrolase [Alphaproteobacteria bacterium]
MIPITLSSLNDITDKYDTFFVDMYGVLWDGVTLYDGVTELFTSLHACGKRIYILSNATTLGQVMAQKAADKGLKIGAHYDGFITSGDTLADKLQHGFFGEIAGRSDYHFYTIGRDNPLLFKNETAHRTTDLSDADFVYVGSLLVNGVLPFDLSAFEPDLKAALAHHLPLVCANPDLEAFREHHKHLTGGSAAKWYADHGGKVYYIGKPYSNIFQYALKKTGATLARSIMVGDSLRTDIAGAVSFHMASVLIYGQGLTADELRAQTLETCYATYGVRPTYLLKFIK